ncbi:serine/threonine-protein kinase [Parafannyhessea umbonata]|uniref:non-specific serine/threonine protein kinase n=1 Tax=Parafannyhessea umbonata TaxID=604330 RepID=A0A6N7XC28_9ACTN|nr:serine/threonine-protein kinase [Parafannyhessea umbonata]MST60837.1 serine/threonine protein kinase [Parafannyhessea umbonata]
MPAIDSTLADPDDQALLAAMDLDDSFVPVRVLAQGDGGTTELVARREPRPGEPVLLVRKRMPAPLANESAWRALQVAELAGTRDAAGADGAAGAAPGEVTAVPAAKAAGVSRLPHVRELYRLPDALVAVYDYVEGPTLRELVRERGPLAPARAVALARQLCQALAPLHAAGVVHRDIAPGNVVVAADGAHLIDLGIARMRVDGASHDTTRLGTWGFAAPEQYGFAQTDARSDVFSLGRVLAYALTAADPADASFDSAAQESPLVLPALRKVIKKATAFEPSARYRSAGELERALAATIAGVDSTRVEPAASAVSYGVAGDAARAGDAHAADVAGTAGDARALRDRDARPVERARARDLWTAFRAVGAGTKAACVLLAAFVAFSTVLLVVSCWYMVFRPTVAYGQYSAVLGVGLAVWVAFAFGWEPVCCLLRLGRYDRTDGRVRVLARREGMHLLWLAALFALDIVAVAIVG